MTTVLARDEAPTGLLELEAGEDRLSESGAVREAVGASGARRVVVELISEGFGNAANNHYYDPELLERVAPLFEGAKMYSNHLPRKKKAELEGLPRDWEHIVGRVKRTWTETLANGRKALVGEAEIISDRLWNVLRKAPDILGVSIDAAGTDASGVREGRQANVVTNITRVGSLDVVSEAGARGRFRELLEAATDEENVSDEQFTELLEAAIEENDDVTDTDTAADLAAVDEATAATPQDDAADETADAQDDGATPAGSGEPDGDPDGEGEPTAAQEASAAEIEAGIDRDTRRRETDVLPGQRAPDRRPASVDDLFGRMTEADRDIVEHEIEARARALAAERLTPAITEALAVARQDFDRELVEALADRDETRERALAQRDQRYEAARLIEAASLPRHTERALKQEFYDAFYADADGQADEGSLREAVSTAITERVGDAQQFAAERVRGVPASGEVSVHEGRRPPPRPAARGRDLDHDVERELTT